jgi:hypothetical protein
VWQAAVCFRRSYPLIGSFVDPRIRVKTALRKGHIVVARHPYRAEVRILAASSERCRLPACIVGRVVFRLYACRWPAYRINFTNVFVIGNNSELV